MNIHITVLNVDVIIYPWPNSNAAGHSGRSFKIKTIFLCLAIPVIKIRRWLIRLIFMMGIPMPVRQHWKLNISLGYTYSRRFSATLVCLNHPFRGDAWWPMTMCSSALIKIPECHGRLWHIFHMYACMGRGVDGWMDAWVGKLMGEWIHGKSARRRRGLIDCWNIS